MDKIKNFILSTIDIYLFFIFLSIKILFFGRQIEETYFSIEVILFPIIASTILLCSFLLLINNKKRIRLILILNFIISFILICDLNYYRYFKDIPSISVVRNGILLGAVKSSIGSLFRFGDLLLFLDLVIFFLIKKFYGHKEFSKMNLKAKLSLFGSSLLLGLVLNAFYIHNLSLNQPRLLSTMFNRVYIAKQLGIVNAHGIDVFNEFKNSLSRRTPLPEEKATEIKSFLQSNSCNENAMLQGIGKGKNLIMIQVEALQQFVIGKSIDGKEITPNLNKWIEKSAYFSNFFYQVSSGGTSDAEFMTNNSLYPASSGAAYYLYSGNEYNSLAKALKNDGYSTAAMHGYKSTFWNRDVMYKNVGFDSFFNERDYNIDSSIGLGLSDESFLKQSIEKIKTFKEPYYSFLITLTSHYPYDGGTSYGDFSAGQFENTLIGNYVKSIHYTDQALGNFFNELETEGILKDSVVVLYGDHSAIPEDNKTDLAEFMGVKSFNDLEWAMLQKVPMFMHFPEDKYNGTYEIFGGEIDIYPTLANIFSLSSKNMLGRDLFNSTKGSIIYRNGSFMDNEIYYYSPNNTYYDISTGSIIPETDILKEKKDYASTQLEYSDDILKHDLLKKYAKENNLSVSN